MVVHAENLQQTKEEEKRKRKKERAGREGKKDSKEESFVLFFFSSRDSLMRLTPSWGCHTIFKIQQLTILTVR
jgi:hypothetical protein